MPEESSTAAATETNVQVAPAITEATAATSDGSKASVLETETQETSLLDDVKAAREEEEKKGKPEEKPEAKAKVEEPKGDDKGDNGEKKDDEKEPDNLTEAEKNKAAWLKKRNDDVLQASAKLAEDRKALEAKEAELKAKEAELTEKSKTAASEKKEDKPADQPVSTALENYKPISLKPYDDGDNENEGLIVAGVEALAKDLQKVLTTIASRDTEIEQLRADNAKLMKLAEPYIADEHGVTQAEVQGAAQQLRGNAEKASESLMAEFGPDSGLAVDPVSLIAALKEYGQGFARIGEIKQDALLSEDAILHCWRHANKGKIEELKGKDPEPKKEEIVPPPVRKGEGPNATPPKFEDMSEREKTMFDYQQEVALLNGKR